MVHEGLSARKSHVGNLLKTIRKINTIQLASEDDLLQGCHTISSEPYVYETGYKSSCLKQVTVDDHHRRCLVTRGKCPEVDECTLHDMAIPVDEKVRRILSKPVGKEKSNDDRPKNWKCCELCKTLTNQEIDKTLTIKKSV